jgi:hypothetical protein
MEHAVAENQVQENHWFQFVEPMSEPTNEPTGKPPKAQVAYSEPKQDAELPSKITDSQLLKHVGYATIKNQSRNL